MACPWPRLKLCQVHTTFDDPSWVASSIPLKTLPCDFYTLYLGHKSDTVVQGYIDKSDLMKRKCADAIAYGSDSAKDDEHVHKKSLATAPATAAAQQIHYHYYFNGANINAPMQFH